MLEQFLPKGRNHPFARTMLEHFKKLQSPLRVIESYQTLDEQNKRFAAAGWPSISIRGLWDIWQDSALIPVREKQYIDEAEPFEEWEEFSLFANHYFCLYASNYTSPIWSCNSSASTHRSSPENGTEPYEARAFSTVQRTGIDGRRRFAAIINRHDSILLHGGLGQQSRRSDCDWFISKDECANSFEVPRLSSGVMCHNIVNLAPDTYLLVGGRASPSFLYSDCWLYSEGSWKVEASISPRRYRASAVTLSIPSTAQRVALVYGGRTAEGDILDDWQIWRPGHQWKKLKYGELSQPAARFGACLVVLNDRSGWLFGGMTKDYRVARDFWFWEINEAADSITLRDLTARISTATLSRLSRFGAVTAGKMNGDTSPVVVGGISADGLFGSHDDLMRIGVQEGSPKVVSVSMTVHDAQPLLIGIAADYTSDGCLIILGGGAICFSFGMYWSTPIISSESFSRRPHKIDSVWRYRKSSREPDRTVTSSSEGEQSGLLTLPEKGQMHHQIRRIRISAESDVQNIVADGHPTIIENLNLGPCTHLWTSSYLSDRIGSDQMVSSRPFLSPSLRL